MGSKSKVKGWTNSGRSSQDQVCKWKPCENGLLGTCFRADAMVVALKTTAEPAPPHLIVSIRPVSSFLRQLSPGVHQACDPATDMVETQDKIPVDRIAPLCWAGPFSSHM